MTETITFRPSPQVRRMMERATRTKSGAVARGLRTHLINEILYVGLLKQGFGRKKETAA